jgi:hypothetical protein
MLRAGSAPDDCPSGLGVASGKGSEKIGTETGAARCNAIISGYSDGNTTSMATTAICNVNDAVVAQPLPGRRVTPDSKSVSANMSTSREVHSHCGN